MRSLLVAFGANLGPAVDRFHQTGQALERIFGTGSVRTSPLYETLPVGGENQALGRSFLNGMYQITTDAPLLGVFEEIQSLQRSHAGQRTTWSPREIDLDLVWSEDPPFRSDALLVPHPRMHFRWFVLRPAADLLPHALHPLLGQTVEQLLALVCHGSPRIVWLGEQTRDFEQARQRIQERWPAGELICRPSASAVALERWGEDTIAVSLADHLTGDWLFVAQPPGESFPPTERVRWGMPAVDLCPAGGKSRLDRVGDFLDSLTVGKRWEGRSS